MINTDNVYKQVPGYLLEEMDGEIVLLHPAKKSILYCNQSSALIWSLIDGQRSVGTIHTLLVEGYPESKALITNDLPEVLNTLVSYDAIVQVS